MRRNTSGQVIGAQMVSASDGSAFTGSVTCYVTGNGGTQAVGSVSSGACVHEGNGFHTYSPSQAETNYAHVAFTFVGAGAVPATVQVYTKQYDSSGRDQVDVLLIEGTDATNQIRDAIVDDAIRIDASALNTASTRVATALPNAAAGANGGLPTVNASNYIAGIQGTINTLDALDTAQDSQHSATQGLVTTVDGVVDAIKAVTDNLPDGGELSSLATASDLSAVEGNVDAIKAVTDKLDDTLEDNSGTYRFTEAALAEAPSGEGGGGGTDWSADERAQIKAVLGITSSGSAPGDPSVGILDEIRDAVGTRASQTSVDTIDGIVDDILADTADMRPKLGSPAGASISADIAAIKSQTDAIEADTQDLQTQVGTAGAGLTALPWNPAWDTEVQSEVADALTAYDAPTNTDLNNALGGVPTGSEIADAVLDEVVEGTTTLRQSIRLHNAVLGGKASGLETTSVKYRDLADTKDRVTATVDQDGNRSAVTRDLT